MKARGFSAAGYVQSLKKMLEPLADPDKAEPMKRYMKGRFEFLGIQMPQRQSALRALFALHGLPTVDRLGEVLDILWGCEYREYQYCGLELIYKSIKKVGAELITLLERLVTEKPWWDTVDMLAQKCIGPLLLRFPELSSGCIHRWTASENIWLIRTAILFQNRYKNKTNFEVLAHIITQQIDVDEFFIQKAIGWALREYAKTDGETVLEFVGSHPLTDLAKREALRHLKKEA